MWLVTMFFAYLQLVNLCIQAVRILHKLVSFLAVPKINPCIVVFYPTALKDCRGIVFTHGVRMGGWTVGKSLSVLYFRNRKV